MWNNAKQHNKYLQKALTQLNFLNKDTTATLKTFINKTDKLVNDVEVTKIYTQLKMADSIDNSHGYLKYIIIVSCFVLLYYRKMINRYFDRFKITRNIMDKIEHYKTRVSEMIPKSVTVKIEAINDMFSNFKSTCYDYMTNNWLTNYLSKWQSNLILEVTESVKAKLANFIDNVKTPFRGFSVTTSMEGVETVDINGKPVVLMRGTTIMALGDLGRSNAQTILNITNVKTVKGIADSSIKHNKVTITEVPDEFNFSDIELDSESENNNSVGTAETIDSERQNESVNVVDNTNEQLVKSDQENDLLVWSNGKLVVKTDIGRQFMSKLKHYWNAQMVKRIRDIYPELCKSPLHKLDKKHYLVARYIEWLYLKNAVGLKDVNDLEDYLTTKMEPESADETDIDGVYSTLITNNDYLHELCGYNKVYVHSTILKLCTKIVESLTGDNKYLRLIKLFTSSYIGLKTLVSTYKFIKTLYYKLTEPNLEPMKPKYKASMVVPNVNDSNMRFWNLNLVDSHSYVFIGSNKKKTIKTEFTNKKVEAGQIIAEGIKALDAGTVAYIGDKPLATNLHVISNGIKNLSPVDYFEFNKIDTAHISQVHELGEKVYIAKDKEAVCAGRILCEKVWYNEDNVVDARIAIFITTSNKLHGLSGSAMVNKDGKLVGLLTGSFNSISWLGKLIDYLDVPHDRLVIIKYGQAACSIDLSKQIDVEFGDLNSFTTINNNSGTKAEILAAREKSLACFINGGLALNKFKIVTQLDNSLLKATVKSTFNFNKTMVSKDLMYVDFVEMRKVIASQYNKHYRKFNVKQSTQLDVNSSDKMPGGCVFTAPTRDDELKKPDAGSSEEKVLNYINSDNNVRTINYIAFMISSLSVSGYDSRNIDVVIDFGDVTLTDKLLLLLLLIIKNHHVKSMTIIIESNSKLIMSKGVSRLENIDKSIMALDICKQLMTYVTQGAILANINAYLNFEQSVASLMNWSTSSQNYSEILAQLSELEEKGSVTIAKLEFTYMNIKNYIKDWMRTFVIKPTTWLSALFESSVHYARHFLIEQIKNIAESSSNSVLNVLNPSKWFDANEEITSSGLIVVPRNLVQSVIVAVIDYFISQNYPEINWTNSVCLTIAEAVATLLIPELVDKIRHSLTLAHIINGCKNLLNVLMAKEKEIIRWLASKGVKTTFNNKKHFFSLNALSGDLISTLSGSLIATADIIKEIDYDLIRLSYADWIFRSDSIRNANKRAELNTDILGFLKTGREKLHAGSSDFKYPGDSTGFSVVFDIIKDISTLSFQSALAKTLGIIIQRLLAIGLAGSILHVCRKIYVNYMNMDTRAKAVEAMRDSFRKTVAEQKEKLSKYQTLSIFAATNIINYATMVRSGNKIIELYLYPLTTIINVIEYWTHGTVNSSVWSSALYALISGRNDYALVSLVAIANNYLSEDIYKSAVSVPAAVLLSENNLEVHDLREQVLKINKNVKTDIIAHSMQIKGLVKVIADYSCSSGEFAPVDHFKKLGSILDCKKQVQNIIDGKTACINFALENKITSPETKIIETIINCEKFYEEDEKIGDTRSVFYISNIDLPNAKPILPATKYENAIAPASKKIMRLLDIEENNGLLLEPTEIELALGIRQRAQGSRQHVLNWREYVTTNRTDITSVITSFATYLRLAGVKSKALTKDEINLLHNDIRSKPTSGLITRKFTGLATMKSLSAVLINNNIDETTVLQSAQYMHNMFPKVEVVAKKEYKQRTPAINKYSRKTDDNRIRVIHAAEGFRRLYHRLDNIWFNNTLILSRFVIPVKIGLKSGFEWVSTVKSSYKYSAAIDISNFDANEHKGFDLLAALTRLATGCNDTNVFKGVMLHGMEISWRVSITGSGTVLVSTGTMASGDVNTSADNSMRVCIAIMLAYKLLKDDEIEMRFYCQGDNAVIECEELAPLTKLIKNLETVGLPTKIEGLVDRDVSLLLYTPEYLGMIGVKMTIHYINNKGTMSTVRTIAPWRATNRLLPKLITNNHTLSEKNMEKMTKVKIMCWLITWPLDYNIIGAASKLNIEYDDLRIHKKQVLEYFESKREESLKRYESEQEVLKGWNHWAFKSVGLIGMGRRIVKTSLGWSNEITKEDASSIMKLKCASNEKKLKIGRAHV